MSDINLDKVITTLALDDYFMVVHNGCIKWITKEDFIKDIYLGGFSVCETWVNCVEGIGLFDDPLPLINLPPTMGDVFVSLINRKQDYVFTSNQFLSQYYDAESDAFGKIIITSGDLSGYSLNGNPLFIGQVLISSDLAVLDYDSKNSDSAYSQEFFFDTYDVNNVKAQ